jgi:hypothetical protein
MSSEKPDITRTTPTDFGVVLNGEELSPVGAFYE